MQLRAGAGGGRVRGSSLIASARAALCLLAASAGAARAEPARDAKPAPEPRIPRFGVGVGLGFPQLMHADASLWLTPGITLDGRAWIVTGIGLGQTDGFELGASRRFGRGRHALRLSAGVGELTSEDPWEPYGLATAGWSYLGDGAELRVAAGVLVLDGDSADTLHVGSTVALYPTVALTWLPLFGAQ